jgi:D-alanyl-D-alanine carboxypeptidase
MHLPVQPLTRPRVLTGQSNGQLSDAILVDIPGQDGGPTVRLVEPAARAWIALCAAARRDGHILKAVGPHDSFRPLAVQERIFRERYTTTVIPGQTPRRFQGQLFFLLPGRATAAVPGTSNHGWGLAVDTGVELDSDAGVEEIDDATVAWLVANEHRFGFSHELQSEPWHIRYFAGDDIPPDVKSEDDFSVIFNNVGEFNTAVKAAVRESVQAELVTVGDPTRKALLDLARRAVADEFDTAGSRTRTALVKLLRSHIESDTGELHQALAALLTPRA